MIHSSNADGVALSLVLSHLLSSPPTLSLSHTNTHIHAHTLAYIHTHTHYTTHTQGITVTLMMVSLYAQKRQQELGWNAPA